MNIYICVEIYTYANIHAHAEKTADENLVKEINLRD